MLIMEKTPPLVFDTKNSVWKPAGSAAQRPACGYNAKGFIFTKSQLLTSLEMTYFLRELCNISGELCNKIKLLADKFNCSIRVISAT